jgi:hypothetical protein
VSCRPRNRYDPEANQIIEGIMPPNSSEGNPQPDQQFAHLDKFGNIDWGKPPPPPPPRSQRDPPPQNGQRVAATPQAKKLHRLPPYEPFPCEHLPPVIREYSQAAAQAIGCDVGLVALPALATAGSAIGNARAIVLKKGWVEPPIIWAITIGDSGTHKSPAFYAAVSPYLALQLDEHDKHVEAMKAHQKALAAGEQSEEPEKSPGFITNDPTIEALAQMLSESPKGVFTARDELDAWFSSLSKYKSKSATSDRGNWLELHRAGTLISNRVKGGLIVRRACSGLAGTIQPGVLTQSLDQAAMAAGLGARFLLSMPPKQKHVWTEAQLEDDLARRYQDLLKSLRDLPLEDVTKRKPVLLGMSNLAKLEFVPFYNEWGEVQFGAQGSQASAFAKIEGYAPRLALVHHVVTLAADPTPAAPHPISVTQPSMRAGIALAKWFANELTRVYAMLGETEEEQKTRTLVEWIDQNGERDARLPKLRKVTARQMQRANAGRWPHAEAARADLDLLASGGHGHWGEEMPDHRRPGRPRRMFHLSVEPIVSDSD